MGARAAQAALTPLEALYRAVVAGRNALYDAGVLRAYDSPIPVLSVGNLSVGGTGKTPFAAHLATALCARGAQPAIVMRGYGGDEARVHAALNPHVPILTSGDRRRGLERAVAGGADVAILDDGFQHRAVQRMADLVLIAAEQWTRSVRCLPAGPYREPASSLRRATTIVVTRKSASPTRAAEVADEVRRFTGAAVVVARLRLDELRRADGTDETRPLASLASDHVLAIAGIGNPHAFRAQLAPFARAVTLASFGDHHAFGAEDVAALSRSAEAVDSVVCTLKDAVKLASFWPRAAKALWYVSQRVELEAGEVELEQVLRRLLEARTLRSPRPRG